MFIFGTDTTFSRMMSHKFIITIIIITITILIFIIILLLLLLLLLVVVAITQQCGDIKAAPTSPG